MAYQKKATFDPFVMLEWSIQVFYIQDKLHLGWVLVHEADITHAQPIIYKFLHERRPMPSKVISELGDLEEKGLVEFDKGRDKVDEVEEDV